MHQGQSEVVVLRPTAAFISFLASALPDIELPSLDLLQTDNTAYVIQKNHSEEGTLAELEKHYLTMFQHEMVRAVGKKAPNKIASSFFDFLCCFKFELHSDIVLMEPSIEEGQQLLVFKPRSVLIKWIKSTMEDQEDLADIMARVHLSNLVENTTVVVKNFSDMKKITPFLNEYYKPIFETLMSHMSGQRDHWPVVHSFQAFHQYFSIEIHSQLVYLGWN